MDMQLRQYIKIDKDLPVPLYYQLKSQLAALFDKEYFKPGDKLPTEAELCALLEISRPTVRQAFSELIAEGRIIRKKAKGTFVAQPKVEGFFFQKLGSYDEEMQSLHLRPSTKVLCQEVITAPSCCAMLDSSRVLHLQRLRYADDEEMVFVDTYVPYELFAGMEQTDFTCHSLYAVMEKEYGCIVDHVERSVEAAHASPAVKKQLAMEEDDVVLHVETTAYRKDGRAVEFSIASYHGQRNRFRMKLSRTKEAL